LPRKKKEEGEEKGEEKNGACRFFRLLNDDFLILTDEFIGPDLREPALVREGKRKEGKGKRGERFERKRGRREKEKGKGVAEGRTFKASLPLFVSAVVAGHPNVAAAARPHGGKKGREKNSCRGGGKKEREKGGKLICPAPSRVGHPESSPALHHHG